MKSDRCTIGVAVVQIATIPTVILDSRFTLVLHGHLHAGWCGEETWPGCHGDHVLRIASAPSLGSAVADKHGFNEITITRDGDDVYRATVDCYVRAGASWTVEATMGPFRPGTAAESARPPVLERAW